MGTFAFPLTQGELIRTARGDRTQQEFADTLGVHRSCLSRYESEGLGAPAAVINHCLQAVAALASNDAASPVQRALRHARLAVTELEVAATQAPRRRAKA